MLWVQAWATVEACKGGRVGTCASSPAGPPCGQAAASSGCTPAAAMSRARATDSGAAGGRVRLYSVQAFAQERCSASRSDPEDTAVRTRSALSSSAACAPHDSAVMEPDCDISQQGQGLQPRPGTCLREDAIEGGHGLMVARG